MMPYRQSLSTLALLLTLGAGTALAQDDGQRIVVPLSDPKAPVRLHVDLFSGRIEIVGYDGNEVVVVASSPAHKVKAGSVGGMKRIPNTSIGLAIEERNNRVSVVGEWHDRSVHVKLQVPYETSGRISSVNHGDIVVRGLVGELELENTNGGIEASDITGSVVANTTNGAVKVSFVELTRDKAMSFTSLNGNIDVTFPDGLRADLRISPGRGDVLTDFDVEVQPTTPEVKRGENGGTFRVELGNDIRATVGGGGPLYRLKTFNGNIYIRRSQI